MQLHRHGTAPAAVFGTEDFKEVRYLRSKSNTYASEETMMAYMRHQIYSCLSKNAPLAVIQIILRKQKWKDSDIDLENAA